MRAGQYDLYIERGADFIREVVFYKATGTPINLTGAKIEMQIRENAQSSHVICTPNIYFSDASVGKAIIHINHTETANMPAYGSNYSNITNCVYDVYVEYPSMPVRRNRVLNGFVMISPEVTK